MTSPLPLPEDGRDGPKLLVHEGGAASPQQRSRPVRVLLVEDDPEDVLLVTLAFSEAAGREFRLEQVDRLASAHARLAAADIDLVLLDFCLPDGQGLEALTSLHIAAPQTPIVVLTGRDDEDVALAAIQAGAQDYLLKGEIRGDTLLRAVRYALERHRISEDLREKTQALSGANAELQEMNRQKDEFISRVSHELRTPIAAIYQFASIMADGLAGEITGEQSQYLSIVMRNTRELHTMVGELIEATRAEAGKIHIQPRRVAVGPIISDVVQTARAMANLRHIAVHAELALELPPALADASRVRQILVNLVDNALRFTPEEGRVVVRASVWDRDARFLRVGVQDSGEGMRPEVRQRVFDRFFQDDCSVGSRQGLGLGLFICKQLVDLQGGSIGVESAMGAGSTFWFTLPVFMLQEILRPLGSKREEAAAGAALLCVQAIPPRRFFARRNLQGHVARWRTLVAAALPAHAVLLPEMGSSAASECLYVVARAAAAEAPALGQRLREALAPTAPGTGSVPSAAVTYTVLELARGSTWADLAPRIETLVAQTDEAGAKWNEVP